MHNIINSLNWRYATKAFDPSKKVSKEDLDVIIESFRLSPSSFGLQAWKMFVVQDQDVQNSLVEHSWGQTQVADCSELLVLARPTKFDDTNVDEFIDDIAETRWQPKEELEWYAGMMKGFLGNMGENTKKAWMEKQIYIALGNLMTVCATMDIDSCPIEWFLPPKYDEILGLTEQWYASVVVLAVWYRDESDKYATAKKVRFSTDRVTKII